MTNNDGASHHPSASMKDSVTYVAFSMGWKIVRRLPERRAYRLFERFADRLWARRGGGVLQLERNLKRVVPEATDQQLREMSKESMRRYFRYWCDAFRMPDWSPERIVDTVEVVDEHHLRDAYEQGHGVVVALAHSGNYDQLGAWAVLTLGPLTSVAERLKPEKLFEKFLEYRRSIGLRIYPLGEPGLMDTLVHKDLREEHHIVALVSDRDLTAHGVPVMFFGELTRMPAGPASLALRSGAPLHAAVLWYDGPKSMAKIYPPIPVPESAPTGDGVRDKPGYKEAVASMTQAYANYLEEGIREHPMDWHMMQKLWLSDLDQVRLAASDAKAAAQTAADAAAVAVAEGRA